MERSNKKNPRLMAFSCKFHMSVCRYAHSYAQGQITGSLIAHLTTENVSSCPRVFDMHKSNQRQSQCNSHFTPEWRTGILANSWNELAVSPSFMHLWKLQQGIPGEKPSAKARHSLWEGQQESAQLYLPSASTPLSLTIPNSVPNDRWPVEKGAPVRTEFLLTFLRLKMTHGNSFTLIGPSWNFDRNLCDQVSSALVPLHVFLSSTHNPI